MKLFVSVFACLAALAASSSVLQRKLEHSLDVAQGPLLNAMFDYQNRGYRHFSKALTAHLNEITALRVKIQNLSSEEIESKERSLEQEIESVVHSLSRIIKNPSPNELLKAQALFLTQIDHFWETVDSKKGGPERLVQMVKEIVADEAVLAASASSILTPEGAALKESLPGKYEKLAKELENQKIPTIEEIELFVTITQKQIDGLKFSPESIQEALTYTDVLNTYKMSSYLIAKQLPIDSIEKVDKYSQDIGEFYKTLYSVYKFDGGH